MDTKAQWGSPSGGSCHAGKCRDWGLDTSAETRAEPILKGPWGEGQEDPRKMNPMNNPQIVLDFHVHLPSLDLFLVLRPQGPSFIA